MTADTYRQLLGLAAGVMIVAAVLALWRRSLTAIVRILAVQGLAVAAIAAAGRHLPPRGQRHRGRADMFVVVKVVVIPFVLLRVVRDTNNQRQSEPLVNVSTTIVGAAILTVVAFAATRGLVGLHPSPEADALPAGFAVVLIAFFGLVVRRNALVQVVGFLMLENGIAAVALLAAAGISLTVELAVALDLLLAVLVLQILTHPHASEVRRARARPPQRADRLMLLLALLSCRSFPASCDRTVRMATDRGVDARSSPRSRRSPWLIVLAVRVLDETTVRFGDGALRARRARRVHGARRRDRRHCSRRGHRSATSTTELATGHTTPGGARLFGALVPLFVAAMLLALLAGNAGGDVDRDRGHHRRDRVPRRSPPQSRRRSKRPGSTSSSDRSVIVTRVPRHGRPRLRGTRRRRDQRGRAQLGHAHRHRRTLGSGHGTSRRRSVAPRLRHQGRTRAHAHLAARRAQPGPRPRLRADVRACCSPSRSR